MKSVAFYDLDNTLYDGFAYFDLLDKQQREGHLRPAVVGEAGSTMRAYKAGRLDYETAIGNLLEIHAIGLLMCKYDDVLASTRQFFRRTEGFFDYVRPLVDRLRPTHDQVLVTGEGQFVAQAVQETLGLDGYCASEYTVARGIFAGSIGRSLARREAKKAAIETYLAGRDLSGSLALGDSEGDIDMLAAVQYPIAVSPNAGLAEWAAANGCPAVEPSAVPAAVERILHHR